MPSEPRPDAIRSIQELYDAGQFVDAVAAAEREGPLDSWTGTEARILAGRLLRHAGAPEAGRRQLLRAWRHAPDDWKARYFHLWNLEEARGPLRAWRALAGWGTPAPDDPGLAADFTVMRARLASALRDFGRAEAWFESARDPAGDRAWWWNEYAEHLERRDRYEDALATAREGLSLYPGRWSLVLSEARTLQHLGRDDEAVASLRAGLGTSQSAYLAMTLGGLLLELERPEESLAAWDAAADRMPRMEVATRHWLEGQRAQATYLMGDLDAARRHAEAAGPGWWEEFARRAADPSSSRRRLQLPVAFVRQHHMTCAPATLTSVARYWGRPADHVALAEAICYDGTPSHAERDWAASQGWHAREFRVTWDVARELLDRGMPFCLTTVQPGNAHQQAVSGYDELRGSLLIRDPYTRGRWEASAEPLLESQRASGPWGMVLVPAGEEHRLDGLELPDAALYDHHHALLSALERHDRASAARALEAIDAAAPGHRLAWQSRRALAGYDANPAAALAAIEGLLALFPGDAGLGLAKLSCLRDLERRDARLSNLEALGAERGTHPLLWRELAWELARDARRHGLAARWLRRFERHAGSDPSATALWARMRWEAGDFDAAIELQRLAACQSAADEGQATAYFDMARARGRAGEALAWLEGRLAWAGRRSSAPARTLSWALREVESWERAFEVLNEALASRPDDAELRLHAAEVVLSCGDPAQADALAAGVTEGVPAGMRGRYDARRARHAGDGAAERAAWERVLEAEPLAPDAVSGMAQALHESEGRAAVLAFLEGRVARFPHHLATRCILVEWSRDEGAEAWEAAVRGLLSVDAAGAWGWRELALALLARQDLAGADAAAATAEALEPGGSIAPRLRGQCAARSGDREAARGWYREALRRSVDDVWAMGGLVEESGDREGRRAALAFVQGELVRQTVRGGALRQFAGLARPVLDEAELLRTLREAREARPDLPEAWEVLAGELRAAGRLDEALDHAREGVERFPLHAGLRRELALVRRARLEPGAELEVLEGLRAQFPGDGEAARELATALANAGRHAEARATLESMLRREPADASTRAHLALLLGRAGENEAALAQLRQVVIDSPGFAWAWGALRQLGPQTGQPDLAETMARELARRRPGEPRSWLVLAQAIPATRADERLEALARIDALSPRLADLWTTRARVLAEAGRLDEAAAACEPDVFGGRPPAALRAQAAWVKSLRRDLEGACLEMRAALGEDPSMAWGWRRLVEWLSSLGDWAGAAEAAETWARLTPDEVLPLGHAAEARLKSGDAAGARRLLEQAFARDAGYEFAGWKLVEMQRGERDHVGARATLARMRGHVGEPELLAAEMEIEAEDPSDESWRGILARAARSTASDPAAMERIGAALAKAGWAVAAEAWVRARLASPETVQPDFGALWVHLREALHTLDNYAVLESLPEGELSRRALARQCDALGPALERGEKVKAGLLGMLSRRAARFHGDTLLWGKAGYALIPTRDPAADAWFATWRDHPDAEVWMLHNAVVQFHRCRDEAEADAVTAEMVRRFPGEAMTARMVGWQAIRSLAAGDPGPARAWLAAPAPADAEKLLPILRAYLEVGSRGDLRPLGWLPAAQLQALRRGRAAWRNDPVLRAALGRIARRISARTLDPRVLAATWR